MPVFGPIPSRRLGRSLGLNMIPPKICTYACIYCQVGSTIRMQTRREAFIEPERLFREVEEKVSAARASGESIDYLTFVPDGEPTLERHLRRQMRLLRDLEIKIAVITNASLIWREDVRRDLREADWVSLKVDAVDASTWRHVNRPHRSLQLSWIMDGMLDFAAEFEGELNTETMLVRDLNDSPADAGQLAEFLARLAPERAYLSVPTRPPAEAWVQPPTEQALTAFYQKLSETVRGVEYLVSYEGNEFTSTSDVEDDLLSITAVHPMREEAVRELISRTQADWSIVERLLERRLLLKTEHEHTTFYTRPLPRR